MRHRAQRPNDVPEYSIDSLEDCRLEPFREIRNRNWTELSGQFIAEGPLSVESLVHSKYAVRSILLDRKYADRYRQLAPPNTDLLLVDHALVEQIVGYNFHRGVIACGLRQPLRSVQESFAECTSQRETLMCAVGVQDPENLAGILRSCAALGIERVIIGPGTADPLARRVLRVSLGTVLGLQLFRSRDLLSDISWLRQRHGVTCLASSLASDAEPLAGSSRCGPLMILVGNERYGLPEDVQQQADRRVRIEMQPSVDSLNVCVAAGIIMHYYCRVV